MNSKNQSSYENALHIFTVSQLKDLCKLIGITGISALKKAEIVRVLICELVKPETFRQICFFATPKEIETFKKFLVKSFSDEEEDYHYLYYWNKMGYCFVYENGQVIILDEAKQLFQTLDEEFWTMHHRFFQIYNHIEAAIHLYGVIPIEAFLNIFNGWEKEKLNSREFMKVCDQLEWRLDLIDFELYDGLLFDQILLDEDNGYFAYEAVYERQGIGPYYIPKQSEFLKYSDANYFDYNKEYELLQEYIECVFQVEPVIVSEICKDIANLIHLGYHEKEIITDLERKGIQADKFHSGDIKQLINNIINNTRSMLLRGFTPIEANEPFIIEEKKRSKKRGRERENTLKSGAKIVVFPRQSV